MKGSSGNDWMVRKHMDSAETCWIRVVSLWFDAAGWKVRKHMDSTETCWIRVVSLWFSAALRWEPLFRNSQPGLDRPGCSNRRAFALQELQGEFPPSRSRKSSESHTLIQNVCIWTICFLPLSDRQPEGRRVLYGGYWWDPPETVRFPGDLCGLGAVWEEDVGGNGGFMELCLIFLGSCRQECGIEAVLPIFLSEAIGRNWG